MTDNWPTSSNEKSWLYHPVLPKHWKRCPLYSLANWVNGIAFRNIHFSAYGKPVIKIAEIKGGISKQTKFTQQSFEESVRVRKGDLLFSWSGQPETSIDVFWWRGPEGWLNQHVFRITPREGITPTFLYYLLRYLNANFIGIARNKQTTGLGHVTRHDLEKIEAGFPPLQEQRAIANILGTLDDKIELNRRMNETLEAMARAIFKSWFVDFDPVIDNALRAGNPIPSVLAEKAARRREMLARAEAEGRGSCFPKHIADLFSDRFVDSDLGPIPEGWKVKSFVEYVDNFDSKRIPISKAERSKRQGQYPYHGAAGVMDYVDDYIFDGIYLLVGEDGSVINDEGIAVTQYVWGKLWVNNHAHVLQGKGSVSTEQLYLYFQFEPVSPYVTGAVQPKLSQGRMNTMPFVFGGDNLCQAFTKSINPFFAKLRSNVEQSKTLSELRDNSLPKLISGELRVKEAEQQIKKDV